jgi:hypothetical protein
VLVLDSNPQSKPVQPCVTLLSLESGLFFHTINNSALL